MNIRKPLPEKPYVSDHKSPALRALFPSLIQLRVELEFNHGESRASSSQVHILHPPASASFRYPCPYGDCHGQFKLDMPVMGLLQKSGAMLVNEVQCRGVRPQDRITGKACASSLKYRVEASYG